MVRKTIPWIAALFVVACILTWALASAAEAAPDNTDPENGCLDCHLTLDSRYEVPAREWLTGVHAEYDVVCTDCHGGDPRATTKDEAMSEEFGFIGHPPKDQIPQLCGGCHADPERMGPYGVPTNQLSEYGESKHGQLLAKGDQNVAACHDCHNGHAALDAESSNSTVYPVNLPVTCARCHSDTKLMEPYRVDTHQYELFRRGVHGVALLEERNLGAPTCATCHGDHGTALPGLGELVDVCGLQCHPLAEDAYLSGSHNAGKAGGSDVPSCVTCHGRYDIQEADEQLLVGTRARHCGSCHSPESPAGQIASLLYQEIAGTASTIAEAESLADTPEQEQILLLAQTRLREARVLQHAAQLDLVRQKTEQARQLSARMRENFEGPEPVDTIEWNLVSLLSCFVTPIVILLAPALMAWVLVKS